MRCVAIREGMVSLQALAFSVFQPNFPFKFPVEARWILQPRKDDKNDQAGSSTKSSWKSHADHYKLFRNSP